MIYCGMCSTALLERDIAGQKYFFCSLCGAVFMHTEERRYKYIGTTKGNQALRELLAFIDKEEAERRLNDAAVALKVNTPA